MVLSHSKLKRKRKEEAEVKARDGGDIVVSDITHKRKAEVGVQPGEAAGVAANPDAKSKRKKKRGTQGGAVEADARRKRKRVDEGVADDISPGSVLVIENGGDATTEEKMKKKKKKKARIEANMKATAKTEAETKSKEVSMEPVAENGSVELASAKVLKEKRKKKKPRMDSKTEMNVDKKQEMNTMTYDGKEASNGLSSPTSPTKELHDPGKVYVGGMPYLASEEDIHYYFSECGEISELDCLTFPDTGNFRGIAFITFKTEDGAAKALEYDGADMGGRFLKIEKCILKPRRSVKDPERGEVQKTEGCFSAYIGNLSWDITEDAIKSFFKTNYSSSKIDAIRLSFDKNTGEFQGYGHMDFGDDESLEAAMRLNQKPLIGRPLKIAYAVPPKGGRDRYKEEWDGANTMGNGNDMVNGTSKSRTKVATCYNCGEEGHKSFVCPHNKAS